MIEELENRSLELTMVEDFLINLKQEFKSKDDELVKVVELKKIEQESKIMRKFIQKFRRAARESSFERRLLIKEFKREMNRVIWRKLTKVEHLFRNIEQWYRKATNLNRYQKGSR